MPVNTENYNSIKAELSNNITLVAVSKTKPNEDILALYNLGQRDFGENYVQELVDKETVLPKDIHWHFIGHLQSNKVKYIAPFVQLIHGVDSENLLKEINKQAVKLNRTIDCLLQMHIAQEDTKFGLDSNELDQLMTKISTDKNLFTNVNIKGLMGMASFSSDNNVAQNEFATLKSLFDKYKDANQWSTLSMGMSGDYVMAVEQGSTMVRIGSLLFGERNYKS